MQTFYKKSKEQECIPVAYVPSASVAVEGREGGMSVWGLSAGGCLSGGDCLGGVSAQGHLSSGDVCPVGVSVQWGCQPRGCLPGGVSARVCVPHPLVRTESKTRVKT